MARISDITEFSTSVKRFMQRRKYNRLSELNGGRKRLRVVKLGGHGNGRRVWKLKFVPKLKLGIIKSAVNVSVKSLPAKIKDGYVKMMVNLAQFRFRQPPAKMGVEDFNDKIIVEIYKSFGRQVKVVPCPSSTRAESMFYLNTIVA